MNISSSFKKIILSEFIIPLTLLIIGIYHGLMQVLYISGTIHRDSFLGLNYYQGLTLHGVINAVVLTTFFGVAFGNTIVTFYLKKEPPKFAYRTSFWLMVIGTVIDAITMLLGNVNFKNPALQSLLHGKGQALYTFYAPLDAGVLFYVGTAILIVGSWIAFFGWIKVWFAWKKENPTGKMPLAVLGMFVDFTLWVTCTIPVAISVLVILTPWSAGWVTSINISLTRTLFWMFGHALVYFWLLPSYVMFYTVLPKITNSKLYSSNAARLAFMLFLILSIPIGVHHQFSEPSISPNTKLYQAILTFGVAIPSFMTAFNIAATLEYAGKKRGSKGLFGWMFKLPYFRSDNFLFGYLICGLVLFIFGGLTGIVNASYSLNAVVHNTSWISGHFHMTVAGPVFLGILGMTLFAYAQLSGKEIKFKRFATISPYVWVIGIALFSHGLMAGGLMGEPRRTNLGLTYTNPDSPLFNRYWLTTTTMAMVGGIIMTFSSLLYFISFFGTVLSKRKHASTIDLPVYEDLHEEKKIPLLLNMKPWVIVMVVLIAISYIPAITQVTKYSNKATGKYNVDNPVSTTVIDSTSVK
ncbi:MAG: cbb3-type cytochrome c oxidase subunit I [Chitinophagaceae bacterium]|jgi:cytochrome c oxidase subunit 1|nr:cbb3-type cytochrome c oxidase subunit I [Chitinophagaceae bacterium]